MLSAVEALQPECADLSFDFSHWRRIEAAAVARAREGAPREKFTRNAEMLAARG